FIFRGARWRLLLINATREDEVPPKPLPVLYSGRVILMSQFANSVTFFRVGDAFRAFVFANDTKTSFPRSLGTVLADRLIDIVVVSVLMAVGLVVLLAGGHVRPPIALLLLAGGFLVAVVAALGAMTLGRRWIVPRLPQRIGDIYHHFHRGTMGSFARMPMVFLLGALSWLCEFGRLFFVIQAVGAPIALGLILFVSMANGVFASIPLTPGGLGIVETGISGLLQLELTVAFEVAVAIALLDRTISYLSIIVTGGTLFAVRQIRAARPGAVEAA
ncbi:MAG: lysylphosphatidylglycerol synthase transmembrane domain-containing protein, partial [Dehalococcoidia bacterium]